MTSEVMAGPRSPVDAGRMTTTTAPSRSTSITHPGLRPFLLSDVVLTGGNGVVYLLASAPLAEWFGMPRPLLLAAGAFLVVVAAGLAVLATRSPVPKLGVVAIAELNLLWALASVGYAAFGGLTGLGVTWTLAQAGVVAVYGARQWWYSRQG